jgi:hypothetical protein
LMEDTLMEDDRIEKLLLKAGNQLTFVTIDVLIQ